MENRQPECSLLITTYNVETTIGKTLESIFSSDFNYAREIIVVDDASSDSTVEICRKYDVTLITLTINGGPARARNIAIKKAHGDYLIFIDSDVEFESDLLQQMMDTMKSRPELSGVGSVSDPEPLNPNFFSRYFALQEYHLIRRCADAGITLGICTRCGILKKSLFEEYGGFDERHRKPSIEDYQFSLRIRGDHEIYWGSDFVNKHNFPTGFMTILKRLHRNTREMIGVMKDLDVKDTGPYASDTRARIAIILGTLCCLVSPLLVWTLLPAALLYGYAAFLKRDLLKLFKAHHGTFFALKGWLMYMSICLPLITGTLAGMISSSVSGNRE